MRLSPAPDECPPTKTGRSGCAARAKSTSVPILGIHDLKREVERICGGSPERAKTTEQVVAAIQWVDGTTIDCVQGLGA